MPGALVLWHSPGSLLWPALRPGSAGRHATQERREGEGYCRGRNGERVVVGGERAPDKVRERQGMAGEEEQVTTQECVCVQYTDMLQN